MHKRVQIAKNIHLLFHEQAVCAKDKKMGKSLLDEGK